jgi:hypothetical protein
LRPDSAHRTQIAVKIEEPIVLFSIQMFTLGPEIEQQESLFRVLLEFNSELLHVSYSLQDNQVVLSGAQQLENLDFNEFQAMVDDMCMALDKHYDKIAPRVAQPDDRAAGAEGSA